MRDIAVLWLRAVPTAMILLSVMTLGQVSGGLDQPAPTELITEGPTDLSP